MLKKSLFIGIIAAINLVLIFSFQFYLLIHFGSGLETDAYFASLAINQFALAVLSGSLMQVLVPMLSVGSQKKAENDGYVIIYVLSLLLILLSILLFFSSDIWIDQLYPGLSQQSISLTLELTKIQLIGLVFIGINAIQISIINARQKILQLEVRALIINIISLTILMIMLPEIGVTGAAWISVIKLILQCVILLPIMGLPTKIFFNKKIIAEVLHRSTPLLLGGMYYKTEPMIDRYLLSSASLGWLSIYHIMLQLYGACAQVLSKAFCSPIVPIMSLMHEKKLYHEFKRCYTGAIKKTGIICLIIFFIILILGEAILKIIAHHGFIELNNMDRIYLAAILMCGILIGGALGSVSSSAFYSLMDTKTPTLIGILSYTVFIPLKFLAYKSWGPLGLIGVMSLFVLLNFMIQHFLIYKLLKKEIENEYN